MPVQITTSESELLSEIAEPEDSVIPPPVVSEAGVKTTRSGMIEFPSPKIDRKLCILSINEKAAKEVVLFDQQSCHQWYENVRGSVPSHLWDYFKPESARRDGSSMAKGP